MYTTCMLCGFSPFNIFVLIYQKKMKATIDCNYLGNFVNRASCLKKSIIWKSRKCSYSQKLFFKNKNKKLVSFLMILLQ